MKRTLAVLIPAVTLLFGCATQSSTRYTAYDDGVRLYREGYYASAREAFDAALHQDPNMAAAWNNRGVARARLGDLEGAVLDYTHALGLAPSDAEILFNRGNAYAAGGNLQAAISDFTAATTLRPGYAEAFFNRGAVRAAAGDYAGAIADWQWAVDIDPDPWAKSAMRRAVGLESVSASPATTVAITPRAAQGGVAVTTTPAPGAGTVVTTTPIPQTARPAGTVAPSPADMSGAALDVRALVARAMGREVEGDRPGAVADLRAALMAETDPARRARIDHLLRILEASR